MRRRGAACNVPKASAALPVTSGALQEIPAALQEISLALQETSPALQEAAGMRRPDAAALQEASPSLSANLRSVSYFWRGRPSFGRIVCPFFGSPRATSLPSAK